MNKLTHQNGINLEAVYNNLNFANNKIGELNGMIKLLPNSKVIMNATTLGEAKESSSIENIVTTYDDIFKCLILDDNLEHTSAKEVVNYRQAMNLGLEIINKKGMITTNDIIKIHHVVEPNKGDIRKLPGTVIKNSATGEILFTPPQNEAEIRDYLSNLEQYINDDNNDMDALLKLVPIHYQFECIHPFYDGNGRTGRIINILYLVLKNKLSQPILYMSKYINQTRSEYYRLLHDITSGKSDMTEFANYLLMGIGKMSEFTINFIMSFIKTMEKTENLLKEKLPKIYTHKLIEYMFFDFYTKNECFREALSISRNTATSYLKTLVNEGFLVEERVGRETIYKNVALFDLMDSR